MSQESEFNYGGRIERAEVRDDGLDEVVGIGPYHLERMNEEGIYLGFATWQVWLTAQSPICMSFADYSGRYKDPLDSTTGQELPQTLSRYAERYHAIKGEAEGPSLTKLEPGQLRQVQYSVLQIAWEGSSRERINAGLILKDRDTGAVYLEMDWAGAVARCSHLYPDFEAPSGALVEEMETWLRDTMEQGNAATAYHLSSQLPSPFRLEYPRQTWGESYTAIAHELRRLYLGA